MNTNFGISNEQLAAVIEVFGRMGLDAVQELRKCETFQEIIDLIQTVKDAFALKYGNE